MGRRLEHIWFIFFFCIFVCNIFIYRAELFLLALKVDQVKSVGNRSKFHKRKRKVFSFNSNKMINASLQKLSKKRHMCVEQQSFF